jgi:hypothetical protein
VLQLPQQPSALAICGQTCGTLLLMQPHHPTAAAAAVEVDDKDVQPLPVGEVAQMLLVAYHRPTVGLH